MTDQNKEVEIVLSYFTNNPEDESAVQLLQLFYKGAMENSIGIMRALRADNGEEDLILVGIENKDGAILTYPLARVLTPDDANNYYSPDGKGGWFDPLDPIQPKTEEQVNESTSE